MKKVLSLVLAFAVLATICLALASCNKKLSGAYMFEGPVADTTYEFKGKKVILTISMSTVNTVYSGEYKLVKNDDGKFEITFTFEDSDAAEYSKKCIFEKTETGIKLNGIEYKKK